MAKALLVLLAVLAVASLASEVTTLQAETDRAQDAQDDHEDEDRDGEDGAPQSQHSADHMSKLLKIQEAVDLLTSPLPGVAKPAAGTPRNLGDATPDEARMQAGRKGVKGDLIELDHLLNEFEEAGQHLEEVHQKMPADQHKEALGETKGQPSGKIIPGKLLEQAMNLKSNDDARKVVSRVVVFLAKRLKTGATLSRAELDEVRQFYIDQTANVLARYGYEDSPYGKQDVSARRTDAVAARKNLDKVDQQVRTAASKDQSKKEGNGRVSRVLRYLQQTDRLSDFLSRVSKATADAGAHRLTNKGPMKRLAKLQADEEDITDGIEALLNKIKRGSTPEKKPINKGDNTNKGLAKRAKAESKRLQRLQAVLKRQEAKNHKLKKEAKHVVPKKKAKTVPVPLPKLKEELNGYISERLDRTLKRFREMQHDGHTISSVIKRKVQRYLREITAHLLKTFITYKEWEDKDSVLKEAQAVKAGDAEMPSRLHGTHQMASKRVVEQFIADTWHPVKKPQHVPYSIQGLMQQGIRMPHGGRIIIVVGKP